MLIITKVLRSYKYTHMEQGASQSLDCDPQLWHKNEAAACMNTFSRHTPDRGALWRKVFWAGICSTLIGEWLSWRQLPNLPQSKNPSLVVEHNTQPLLQVNNTDSTTTQFFLGQTKVIHNIIHLRWNWSVWLTRILPCEFVAETDWAYKFAYLCIQTVNMVTNNLWASRMFVDDHIYYDAINMGTISIWKLHKWANQWIHDFKPCYFSRPHEKRI